MSEPTDHDQLFKTVIREFFPDFLTLFFPAQAARFDLSAVTWLTQEVFAAPPDGPKHVLDLVAQLRRATGDPVLALIHVEVESADSVTDIEGRLPDYYFHLRRTQRKPVLPVVLFLKVGLDGIGVRTITDDWEDEPVLTLRYRYIGLPGLSGAEYLRGNNWLGVALSALMRVPRGQRVALGVEAMDRIADAPLTDGKKSLLGDCVETYIDLPGDDLERFRGMIEANATGRVPAVNKTRVQLAEERGVEKGIEKGERRARRAMVLELLEARFGPVPTEIVERIETLDIDALRATLLKVGTAESLAAFRTAVGL